MSEEQGLTKKELREQKRAEKQARKKEEESRAKKESFTQNIFTWGLVSILAIGLILFVGNLRSDQASLEGDASEIVITEGDWIKGNPEAEVTLVEYGDFMCPACGTAYSFVETVVENYGEDMRFVFRHLPILGLKSHAAARATEAAGEQGKFYEMYDLIFENQRELSSATNVENLFIEYATEIGLDLEAYEEAYNSSAVRDRVSEDSSSAQRLRVNSTPTFFLNGQRVNLSSFNQLEDLVVDAIEQSSSKEGSDEENSATEAEE